MTRPAVSYKKKASAVAFYFLAFFILLLFLFPIYWVLTTALKPRILMFSAEPSWFFVPNFQNFFEIIFHSRIPRIMLNSFIAAGSNTGISVIIGFLCAYGISRYRAGGENLLFWVLSIRMLPPIVVCIPLFVIASRLRLIDTYIILPILYLTLNVPFAIWMLKSFIDEIPLEVEESALIDGCSTLGVLGRVVLPLARSGIVTTAIFSFIFAWNEFLLAMVFTRLRARTLPVEISGFIAEHEILWGQMMSTATLAILPPILLVLFSQKFIVRGLTLGAIR